MNTTGRPGWVLRPSANLLLRRESTVTIGLLAVLFVVIAFEYGRDYATTVVAVILALGAEVWLFLSTLVFVRAVLTRTANWRVLYSLGALAGVTVLLYLIRRPAVSAAAPYAGVIGGVVFLAMLLIDRRA